MTREISPEEGEVNPFARVIERLTRSYERTKADPSALERRAREERAAWFDTLRARCDARGVPRGADLRRWALAPALSGQANAALAAAFARRGDPRDARWAVVVLLGDTGVGKSAAMVRAVARHPREARYVFARDAALALTDRPRAFDQERAAAELAAELADVDLLAVDELGTEPAALSAELLHLVAARCTEGRATVLAGNLPLHLFTARYLEPDARFASRLASPQGTLAVIDGLDLRVMPTPQGEP